ncbi:MAG: hypothetical protein A3F89_04125 [Deltaproteobacteria bacterium RIFCSPLOWO2_12_FULL_50_11]|nr:MAG: hypothetical protein A2053_04420 [Deltaproteobacteria bacterium GWA2_50_8]OGQ68447.1 MAG: hypothetical protein A3F89_04125 [Deltaproteobacteria bacterium RIFCSPLOWO2_12_FULL_50_11]
MKKKITATYNFLRNVRNPKSQRIDILKLAKKHAGDGMVALFNQFTKSYLKKTGVKSAPQQKKFSDIMTYFMTLGYIIRCLEEEKELPKSMSMKAIARRRPPVA